MSETYFDKDALAKWFKDNGDNTHRVNYLLNKESLVFDVGGYAGEWAEKIYSKYECKIFIFEPVSYCFNQIDNKFKNNEKIKVFNFGLSNRSYETNIHVDNASSSLYSESEKTEKIKLIDINDFITENNIDKIDLLKINIEGAEFDLLDHMINSGSHVLVSDIQVQFHKMFEDAEIRRDSIRKNLSQTHKLTYDYKFVWENWKKI